MLSYDQDGKNRLDFSGRPYIGPSEPVRSFSFEFSIAYPSITSNKLLVDLKELSRASIGLQKSDKDIKRGNNGKPQLYHHTPQTYNSHLSSTRRNARIGAKGTGAMVAVDIGLQVAQTIHEYNDINIDERQYALVQQAITDVELAATLGWINEKNLNLEDLGQIADFVLRGHLPYNEALREVSIKIVREISQNFYEQYDAEAIIESGIDNFKGVIIPYNLLMLGQNETDENE